MKIRNNSKIEMCFMAIMNNNHDFRLFLGNRRTDIMKTEELKL